MEVRQHRVDHTQYMQLAHTHNTHTHTLSPPVASPPRRTCLTFPRMNDDVDRSAATATMASRGERPPWMTRNVTRAKNAPPSSAVLSRCVNMAVFEAAVCVYVCVCVRVFNRERRGERGENGGERGTQGSGVRAGPDEGTELVMVAEIVGSERDTNKGRSFSM